MRVMFGQINCGGSGVRTFVLPASFANTNYSLTAATWRLGANYSPDYPFYRVTGPNTFDAYCPSGAYEWSFTATGIQ